MSVSLKDEISNIIDKGGFGASFDDKALILTVKINHAHLVKFLRKLKESPKLRFTILTDLFAADFPERVNRFEIGYNLLSLKLNERLIIKTFAHENENIPTSSTVFSAANWYEREIFDLFGIEFNGHPDMRRILTDYGFQGHPLRKDFPVTGLVQVRYDAKIEKVVTEPVSLQQAYRSFDFASPWQGSDYVLPGDEKSTKE
jgi:NADH-quinone oxidoreductase subunit C